MHISCTMDQEASILNEDSIQLENRARVVVNDRGLPRKTNAKKTKISKINIDIYGR